MEGAAFPTPEEIAAERKKKTVLGVSVVGFALGAAFLGTPISAAAFAVVAVVWWGRGIGMVAMFGLAMSLAAWANVKAAPASAPAPDGLERWIGKKDEVSSALAASRGAGGGAPTEAPRAPPPPPTKGAYTVIDVRDGGTIRGFVRISEAKEPWVLIHFKGQRKGCGESHATERMVYGEDRGLGNAVVYLQAIDAGKDWPEPMRSDDRTATIDQKGCMYGPHVQWVRPETQMVIRNADLEEHNIHGYRGASVADTQFNFASPPGVVKGSVDGAMLRAPMPYLVKCDIHPWMNAYVHVVMHPYYDVTSATTTATRKAGEFVLENVPPGRYVLACWHEGMSETLLGAADHYDSVAYSDPTTATQPVTVKPGETVTVPEFTIPAPR